MEKDKIKTKLREGLAITLSEGENGKRDYADVQNFMKKPLSPTEVGLMVSMGMTDDESGTNRGLFNKKMNQKKNSEGGIYQFDEKELSIIRGKLGIN